MAHQILGYFPQNRVNWRLGLVTSLQAYHRHFRPISLSLLLSCRVQSYSSYSSEKKYLFNFYSHFCSTTDGSTDGSLASSSSEDTDIDVMDYDLEVEGSPNSNAQGSDQEAEEAYAGKTQTSI